ncbi:polyphosphate kinase 2 [Bosea sp. 124]|uniref:polyphosphate kinase 2 n=1 Tax=Bosea sp. 124 TaxID=2135642 RepID=UPI000D36BABB|nr:polyphosphate kinase 2 [Bosea sp. 124]PTM39723.1 polyphosphate kinase 2 [Bosea sp. 124]
MAKTSSGKKPKHTRAAGRAVKDTLPVAPDDPRPTRTERKIFDIEAASLPEPIVAAAFRSGGFPFSRRMKRKPYERELAPLQIELQKLLRWTRETGERIVVVFEGRDGSGKGGTIARFTQHLNPRQARVVALPKPSDTEKGQWYFQRYAAELPTAGQIAFFDRSWYNRAGVERVMEFCTPEQSDAFLREAPAFEGMLVRDGIRLIKILIDVGREMQMTRLHARWHDPLKRWKLSPIDFQAIPRFDGYSQAFGEMLERTTTDWAPWHVVRGNDKLRARLNAIRHVLLCVPYEGRNEAAIGELDRKVVVSAEDYLRKDSES